MKYVPAVLLIALAGIPFASAAEIQTPAPAALTAFEVVSVKANKSGDFQMRLQWQPGGRFVAVNVPLDVLVGIAYENPSLTNGLPAWAHADRFDITAKAEREPTEQERPVLLRALLKDRFRVEARLEIREVPVYALVMARTDRRPGPDLRASDVNCDAVRAARAGKPPTITPGKRPQCFWTGGLAQFTAGAVPLDILVRTLAPTTGRPVVDRTGLSGLFDIDLVSSGSDALVTAPPGDVIARDRPSLSAALREQLGLKLEPGLGPAPVLTVTRIERPLDN